MAARVQGVGLGAPSRRIDAASIAAAWRRSPGRGAAVVCASDEDGLTLAWEAGTAALAASGVEAGDVDGLWWGTSRPPFAEGPSHAYLAASLGLARHTGGALAAGSTHSGLEALLAAADAVSAGSARLALVIAGDAIRPGLGSPAEARTGAAACAFVLAPEGGAAVVAGRITRTRPVVDRYRGDDEAETRDFYDPRLFRDDIFVPVVTEVAGALAQSSPRAWTLPDPDGRLGRVIARDVGASEVTSAPVYESLGDTGAAATLAGLVCALNEPGTVAAIAYGGGRCTGITVEVEAEVPGAAAARRHLDTPREDLTYPELLRARGQLVPNGETVPMGVPPQSAMFARGNVEMLGALGGRCADCGTINTPPSVHPTCIACGGEKLEPVELAHEGEVHTYVVNETMPAPFEAPLPLMVIDLDDGARVMLQGAGRGDDIEIGSRVRLVLRRYGVERGVPVYGYKARVITTATNSQPTT